MALPPITGQGIGSLIKPQEALESDYTFATNRPQSGNIIRDELVASQGNDPIVNKLEAYQPSSKRGSREKPLIMKYPVDMGRGEIPHVMQFKAFWRWENPEFRKAGEKLKAEAENTLNELVDATNLVNDGNFNVASLTQQLQHGLISKTEYANAYKLLMDPAFANPSNPSNDNTLSDMLSNPETREEARRQMERNVRSATDRVESIQQDFGNPKEARLGASATEISKDPDFLDNRFNKQLSSGASSKVKDVINSVLSVAGLQLRDPQYDQMVSIYLPVCTRINGEDAFSYTDANMAIATGAAAVFNSMFSSASLGDKLLEGAKQAAVAAATNSANGTPYAGVVPAVTGLVMNPRIEKMFSQKEIRNFSFSWELYPRNQDEVNTIKNIIDTFRYHSHPARSMTEDGKELDPQIMLRVPAEFTIKFLSASGTRGENGFVENEYIPKISRCVLTGIGVDYTPNGVFSTLPDNSPTGYVLTLSFSEIAQLTRQDVEVGY